MEEDKLLLLKDLSARLPYNVEGIVTYYDETPKRTTITYTYVNVLDILLTIKPYLRPMSSMTEKERREYRSIAPVIAVNDGIKIPNIKQFDFLNEHHFDFRGLIDKCLALEAPDGMYEFNNL